MTADVNLTELLARAAEGAWHAHQGQMLTEGAQALATRHDSPAIDAMLDIDPDDPTDMAAGVLVAVRPIVERMVAEALTAALCSPEAVAGIAGVVLAEQYPAHDPDDRSDDWQVRQAEAVARAVVEWITKDA